MIGVDFATPDPWWLSQQINFPREMIQYYDLAECRLCNAMVWKFERRPLGRPKRRYLGPIMGLGPKRRWLVMGVGIGTVSRNKHETFDNHKTRCDRQRHHLEAVWQSSTYTAAAQELSIRIVWVGPKFVHLCILKSRVNSVTYMVPFIESWKTTVSCLKLHWRSHCYLTLNRQLELFTVPSLNIEFSIKTNSWRLV